MKYKRKRAFTLIECMLYIAISTSISMLGIGLLIEARNIHYKFIKENLSINSVEEGFMTIDDISNEGCTIVADSNQNTVSFNKQIAKNEYLIKVLQQNSESIIIKYYSSDGRNGLVFKNTNKIISNIDNLSVINKGKLVYLRIEKDGKTYIKCL